MLSPLPMHLEWRLLVGLACAAALQTAPVRAQPATAPSPPETLETPYQDTQPPAPLPPTAPAPPTAPPAPAAPVEPLPAAPEPARVRRADKRPLGPIRAQRKLALLGEISWNGLAGFGPILAYNVNPHVAFDLGGGLSLLGWKVGVRGRYNFLTSNLTPFVGVGFNATSGLGEVTINSKDDPNSDPERDPVTLDVKPSFLVHGVLGFDLVHKHGFTLLGCIGYSRLLNQHNLDVLSGSLKSDEKQAVNIIFKSGLVLSVAAGYSFE